jgi:transcriptional regulator of aromatic amino acid metabolism
VDIPLPPLRDRKDDIHLLFRKFAADFAHKYKMPPLKLDDDAVLCIAKIERKYSTRNRSRTNLSLETNRDITAATLHLTLPTEGANFLCNKTEKMKVILAMKEKFCTKCF